MTPVRIAERFAAILAFVIFISCPLGVLQAAPSGVTTGKQILADVNKRITNISTGELKALLEKDPGVYLIDVRTLRETYLSGGTIRATRNIVIPRGWLEFRVTDAVPDKDAPIIVYCGTNQRSPLAVQTLLRMGYTNVKNYAEGFFAWKKAGLPLEIADKAPNTFLYSRPQKVIDGVWSAIGATAPATYQNSGHNNNLSFIVTGDGVLVVNAGANYLLAKSLHDEIKKITDQPVKYVVLENGQGHAALGSSYWKEQGVPIIAHADAVTEIEENASALIEVGTTRVRDKMFRTRIVLPDKTFEEKMVIELGGERIELITLGPAHSPGDIMVWMPEKSLIITGDMAFHERLLPVFEHTDTGAWLETWEKFAALKAKYVIPGHGRPTDMAEVTKYTKDYLVFLRAEMQKLIDNGGSLTDAYKIDQSAFEHLDTYEILALQNAGRIFRAMEFE
ncbi:MAG: rhodanese-like domain-containing protein [Alphaproteobacteria bacterium]